MSRSQFQSGLCILRHAWLNLWDERMTTGRINQVATFTTQLRTKLPVPRTASLVLSWKTSSRAWTWQATLPLTPTSSLGSMVWELSPSSHQTLQYHRDILIEMIRIGLRDSEQSGLRKRLFRRSPSASPPQMLGPCVPASSSVNRGFGCKPKKQWA